MTGAAVRGGRLYAILCMTGETNSVCGRGLEGALLQPECLVRQILWWLSYVLFIRLALGLISLVAECATFWLTFFSLRLVLLFRFILLEYSGQKPNGLGPVIAWLNYSNDVHVFVVREANAKFGSKVLALFRGVEELNRIGEWMSRAVSGRGIRVTDRADHRLGSCEELLAVALHAGRMLREIRHVREGRIAGSHFVPVSRWKFVTSIAG